MFHEALPRTYRKLRRGRRLTQHQLAERVRRDKKTVLSWEKGRSRPRATDEEALLRALGCSREEFATALCEEIGELVGKKLLVGDNGDHRPRAPLADAEDLLHRRGDRLPTRLRRALGAEIAHLRERLYDVQRREREVEELIGAALEAFAAGPD